MMISKQNIQTVRKVGGTDSGISGYPNPFPRPCFKYSKQGRGKGSHTANYSGISSKWSKTRLGKRFKGGGKVRKSADNRISPLQPSV